MALSLFAFISASTAYVAVSQFDLYDTATGGTTGDSAIYASMARGTALDEIPKPYRYRIIVPFLARLLPHASDTQVQVAYGLINIVALTLTGWFLFLLLRDRRFGVLPSLLGASLFYFSWVVMRFSGAVLVDAAGYAALALAVYAAAAKRDALLFLAFTVGMFVKETTALAVLVVLLLGNPRSVTLRQLALCAPGIVAYLILRLFLLPTDTGYNYTAGRAFDAVLALLTPSGVASAAMQLALTFGPLWVLAYVGWRRGLTDTLPRRLAAVVPVCLVVPFIIGSNTGRIWFLAFPVVILFATAGIQALAANAAPDPTVGARRLTAWGGLRSP